MTAAKILKMIESVDPSDTSVMDEIDAAVYVYIMCGKIDMLTGRRVEAFPHTGADHRRAREAGWHGFEAYTRSRDALKAIRPDGFYAEIRISGDKFWALASGIVSEDLPTEELAELHAIIQAIEHERKKGGGDE